MTGTNYYDIKCIHKKAANMRKKDPCPQKSSRGYQKKNIFTIIHTMLLEKLESKTVASGCSF